MAGSWAHMTTKQGRLLSNERFAQMNENMGDWYETAEECFGMIWWLADVVAGQLYHDQAEPSRAQALDIVRQAHANYRDGLLVGEVSRPR